MGRCPINPFLGLHISENLAFQSMRSVKLVWYSETFAVTTLNSYLWSYTWPKMLSFGDMARKNWSRNNKKWPVSVLYTMEANDIRNFKSYNCFTFALYILSRPAFNSHHCSPCIQVLAQYISSTSPNRSLPCFCSSNIAVQQYSERLQNSDICQNLNHFASEQNDHKSAVRMDSHIFRFVHFWQFSAHFCTIWLIQHNFSHVDVFIIYRLFWCGNQIWADMTHQHIDMSWSVRTVDKNGAVIGRCNVTMWA